MIARGEYIMSQFGPLAEYCAFLVDGYVAGGNAVPVLVGWSDSADVARPQCQTLV